MLITLGLAYFFFFSQILEINRTSQSAHSHPVSLIFKTENTKKEGVFEVLPGASLMVMGHKIDINQASAHDLEALPGVGPKLAEKIVKNRQKEGRFTNIKGIMRVNGVKQKKFETIKAYIEVK